AAPLHVCHRSAVRATTGDHDPTQGEIVIRPHSQQRKSILVDARTNPIDAVILAAVHVAFVMNTGFVNLPLGPNSNVSKRRSVIGFLGWSPTRATATTSGCLRNLLGGPERTTKTRKSWAGSLASPSPMIVSQSAAAAGGAIFAERAPLCSRNRRTSIRSIVTA